VPQIDDPRQLENAIRFRAHEAIPIPVADAVLDHVTIGDGVDESGSPVRRVLVAFAHRDLVMRHAEACRKAGIRLRGIDLEGFALLRALAAPAAGEPTSNALVVLAIGNDRTVFAVSDGHVCEFTRVLEWGGSSVDLALTRALDLELGEADAVKRSLSLRLEDGADGGLSPVQAEAARAAIRDELGVLGRELVASLNFYQTRPGSLDLAELLVTGGGAQIPGLLEELERVIGVPVRAGDPLARVTLGKKVKRPADTGSFAVAVGLGIES
jgi:type IV pilus assembly protein PilM